MKKIVAFVCLAAVLLLCLSSCASDFDSAKAKLEKEGFTVVFDNLDEKAAHPLASLAGSIQKKINANGSVRYILEATKAGKQGEENVIFSSLHMVEFKHVKSAQDYEKVMKDEGSFTVQRSWKTVWVGTEDAVKIVR